MRPHKYCQRADDSPLPDGAHVNDSDAMRMRRGFHPINEEQATREIYAAAEAIRQVRPRDPVGFCIEEAGIPIGVSFGLASNPRQRR